MRTLAILPVKSFPRAKQRLSTGFEPPFRRRLAEAMLEDVIVALAATSLDGMIVVTAGEAAAELARRHGAEVITDREQGHNEAARLGVLEAVRTEAERVILVPGDCPALDGSELDELLSRPAVSPSVVIVPDRHGTGTNALLITPPEAITPAFGPGSCERHVRLAEQAGATWEVATVPSLALDIDTPEDLAVLGEIGAPRLRTHDLLSRC